MRGFAASRTCMSERCQHDRQLSGIGSRFGASDMEEERKRLMEEQKLARARARVITMETNRRRRALEERQIEWNLQQQQMRENILLQRRKRMQDMTDRFQRAHMPASQRYGQDLKRNVPDIEDALNQIKGTLGSANQQSNILSSNVNISRSCTPTKPSTIPTSSHHQALSAVETSTKLLQEQSMTSFRNCQTEDSQEKEQDHRPQDSHLSDCSDSESLSSRDSLEYEDPNPSAENLQGFYSSFLLGLEKPHSDLELSKQNDLCLTSDITSFSAMTVQGDHLPQSRKLHGPNNKIQEDSEWPNNKIHTSKASWVFPSVEQTPRKKELSATINNLSKFPSSELKTENLIYTASQQHAWLLNFQAHNLKYPEKNVQKLPVSVGTSHAICQVRFMRGILKKQSQYLSGDNKYVYCAGCLPFPEHVALAIRDSVELTKAKTRGVESNNAVKKKLHWFDEEHVEVEDNKQFSHLNQSSNKPEDHQLSVIADLWATKPVPNITPPASTGNHFTKQATADVGVQVSLPERANEVQVPGSSNRTDGLKAPLRKRSARAGAGPVSSRTRRGSVLRPLSAKEMNQMAKTHGKIIAPRPPPRRDLVDEKLTNIAKPPCAVDLLSFTSKQALDVARAVHKDNSVVLFSPDVSRTDTTVMSKPPPLYTRSVSGGNTKGTASSGHQQTQGCTRGGMGSFKNGLCSDHTPTEEEISLLWRDVCGALNTENDKSKLRGEAVESEQAVRRPSGEQSIQPPGSGSKRFSQPSQPTTVMSQPAFSKSYSRAFPDEGLKSTAHLHLAKVHAEGLLGERDVTEDMETHQTQRRGKVQQQGHQQGLTTISMTEKEILLSLERLNQRLLCEHLALIDCIRPEQVCKTGGTDWTHGLVYMMDPLSMTT